MTFSIIIPCYKVERYIRECLDSILSQTVNDPKSPTYAPDCWEAICTDDGSPDGTGKILDEYAARDKRIKVIHQANGGLSSARNAAMDRASGDWQYFLDSDDVMAPWTLESYKNAIEKYPEADMIRGKMIRFEDGVPGWNYCPLVMTRIDLKDRITEFNTDGYFQQTIQKRSVYGDLRWSGMSWCEERPFGAKSIARCRVAVDLSVETYALRIRSGSITHTNMTLLQFKGYFDATRQVCAAYTKSGKKIEPKVMRQLLATWTEKQMMFMFEHLSREERSEAFRYFVENIHDALPLRPMTAWRMFSIKMCLLFRSEKLAWFLFYVPNWLKRKGIHR